MGADIPGFHGKPNDETYILFYQLGIFYPFMRAHGHIEAYRREPYRQLKIVQESVREALFLRYDLIQYLYTMFYLSSTQGVPIMRPMWYEFPNDLQTFNMTT